MATIKTSIGTLTRTSSSSGAKWAIASLIDQDRAFSGSLKSLRRAVREKHGADVEREIAEAAAQVLGQLPPRVRAMNATLVAGEVYLDAMLSEGE